MFLIRNMNLKAIVLATCMVASSASFAQLVVIVAPTAQAPSKDQLADLYLGKNFDFKPLDLSDSAMREQFYKKLANREPSQVKAAWARIVFTGKGLAPIQQPDATAVKKAVASDPKAVGYVDKSTVDNSVKVILVLE